jgi:hypothetical protein
MIKAVYIILRDVSVFRTCGTNRVAARPLREPYTCERRVLREPASAETPDSWDRLVSRKRGPLHSTSIFVEPIVCQTQTAANATPKISKEMSICEFYSRRAGGEKERLRPVNRLMACFKRYPELREILEGAVLFQGLHGARPTRNA